MNAHSLAAVLDIRPDPALMFQYGALSLCLLYLIVRIGRWLKRRAAMRDFATGHQLRFRGTLPSDKYAPYTAFDRVRSAVLISMVMEGRWNDCDVALFDYYRQRGVSAVGVIVSLPHDGSCFRIASPTFWLPRGTSKTGDTLDASGLPSWVVVSELIPGSAAAAIGPQTAARLREAPAVSVETNLGYLFVTPKAQVNVDGVPEFLDFATSVARAIGADARPQ
jgi:hypothetical protein